MILRTFLSALLLTACPLVRAQQLSGEEAEREKRFREQAAASAADTSVQYGWAHSMVTGLNLTQISFKDWVQGGENALSYATYLNGSSALNQAAISWSNSYKLAFGQTRLSSQGLRKTDDEIYFESLLIYKLGAYVNPYVSGTFRTQFAKGFTYDNAGVSTPVSRFLDPAYLTQSAGVAYRPLPELITRLGVAVREIITSKFPRYADKPATAEIEKTRVEGGFESVTEAAWNLAENLTLSSRLDLFAPMASLQRLYVRNDNLVTAKVTKYISTSLGVQFLHDLNSSPRTQIKQVLAMGFSYSIL